MIENGFKIIALLLVAICEHYSCETIVHTMHWVESKIREVVYAKEEDIRSEVKAAILPD